MPHARQFVLAANDLKEIYSPFQNVLYWRAKGDVFLFGRQIIDSDADQFIPEPDVVEGAVNRVFVYRKVADHQEHRFYSSGVIATVDAFRATEMYSPSAVRLGERVPLS